MKKARECKTRCQYGQDVGMSEYSCSGSCAYRGRPLPGYVQRLVFLAIYGVVCAFAGAVAAVAL